MSKQLLSASVVVFFSLISSLVSSLVSSLALAASTPFPEGFKWCVSTAAHQIEGGNFGSDHYAWETARPDRVISKQVVANEVADKILDQVSSPAYVGEVPCPVIKLANDPDPLRHHTFLFPQSDGVHAKICEYSGAAVDHWNRLEEDTELLRSLNAGAYRFSVEWAKIEPAPGVYDEAVLEHYRHEIELLRQSGIEPHVTLFHFTLPNWVREQGGWDNPENAERFARYTEKVYSSIGADVSTWYTLNEPMVHLSGGYLAGVLPPGEKNLTKMLKPIRNLLTAHALAYRALHRLAQEKGRRVQVGIAHHMRVFDPYHSAPHLARPIESIAANLIDQFFNWTFFNAVETGELFIDFSPLRNLLVHLNLPFLKGLREQKARVDLLKGSQDFFGLNYYSRDLIHLTSIDKGFLVLALDPNAKAQGRITDVKWEIYPEGIRRLLNEIKKRSEASRGRAMPVLISENGLADASDQKRIGFIRDHLIEVRKAIADGVPVKGYCHWSLTDNFEWNSGYYPQFGFFTVDLQTFARGRRPSADWFARVAAENGF